MKKIKISGISGESQILIGESIRNLRHYIPENRVVIITDINVNHYYRKELSGFPMIEIGIGEKIKNPDTVNHIYEKLVEYNADRSSFLVGVGGGIVCDITGFVASTFMRGIKFGFVASSLLAQVDASIGGKNGINFKDYKNMIGTFNQPDFVICDHEMLRTLPKKELLCGFSEIVKHTVIGNSNMFKYIEKNYMKALSLDVEEIEKLVYDSLIIKSSIVNRDEREKGERRILNFGHTFGHAFEKAEKLTHGEAVSIGMVMSSVLSVYKELLTEEEAFRIRNLLENLGLPVKTSIQKAKIIDAIRKDKKREGDFLYYILLKGLGNPVIEKLSFSEIEKMIDQFFS